MILQLLRPDIMLSIFLFMGLIMLFMAVYIKRFVKIIPPDTYYRHYRKGVIFREGKGGMVVRIPFLDRLEIGDYHLDSHDETLSHWRE